MTPREHFLRTVDRVNDRVGKAVAWLIVIIMVIVTVEVVLRYVFNRPTIWAWDINIQLAAAMALFGAGYTLLQNAHVKVDVLILRLSSRNRAILDLVTSSLFFICIGALVWKGGEQGIRSINNLELMNTLLHPPIYPLKMAVPVAAFLLLLQGVAKFMRDLSIARSKESQP